MYVSIRSEHERGREDSLLVPVRTIQAASRFMTRRNRRDRLVEILQLRSSAWVNLCAIYHSAPPFLIYGLSSVFPCFQYTSNSQILFGSSGESHQKNTWQRRRLLTSPRSATAHHRTRVCSLPEMRMLNLCTSARADSASDGSRLNVSRPYMVGGYLGNTLAKYSVARRCEATNSASGCFGNSYVLILTSILRQLSLPFSCARVCFVDVTLHTRRSNRSPGIPINYDVCRPLLRALSILHIACYWGIVRRITGAGSGEYIFPKSKPNGMPDPSPCYTRFF